MIYGENIRLRAIEREDLSRFVEWLNDPEVREGLAAYLPMSMAREERWFEDMFKRPTEEQPFAMEAHIQENWILIGSTGFRDFNWVARKAEIGIMIGDKSHWNKGYGTEASALCCNMVLKP